MSCKRLYLAIALFAVAIMHSIEAGSTMSRPRRQDSIASKLKRYAHDIKNNSNEVDNVNLATTMHQEVLIPLSQHWERNYFIIEQIEVAYLCFTFTEIVKKFQTISEKLQTAELDRTTFSNMRAQLTQTSLTQLDIIKNIYEKNDYLPHTLVYKISQNTSSNCKDFLTIGQLFHQNINLTRSDASSTKSSSI